MPDLPPLYLRRYLVSYLALDEGLLPGYLGSTIHGKLGRVMHQLAPDTYGQVFKPTLHHGHPAYKLVQKDPPAPHIVLPLMRPRQVQPGEGIQFELTLVGSANEHIDQVEQVVKHIDQLGSERHGIRLMYGGMEYLKSPVAAPGGNPYIWRLQDFAHLQVNDNRPLEMELQTPLSLFVDDNGRERLALQFGFGVLVERLYRRMALLSSIYCDGQPNLYFGGDGELDKVNLIRQELQRWSVERKPADGHYHRLRGWTGTLWYSGPYQPWWPLLLFGQYTHVGSSTVFGLGKYQLL